MLWRIDDPAWGIRALFFSAVLGGGGFVYSAHDTVLFRQPMFVLPFLRAFKSFSWGMHIPAGDQQVYL